METKNEWLEELVSKAEKKALELESILGHKILPFVFVIEDQKDAATGFFKIPDAKQGFKIIRSISEDYENGVELIARAQLVRNSELIERNIEGEASDPRFMNVNGVYDKVYSELNLSLLMKAVTLVKPYTDQFKKK